MTERLTVSGATTQRDIDRLLELSNDNQFGRNEAYYKLQQYEDLGFTPEEIAIMAKFYKEQTSVEAITADMKIVEKLIKLDKYEKLEEAGRLIELPCKIGDTVYGSFQCYDGKEIRECKVIGIRACQFKADSECYYFVDIEFNIIDPFYKDGRLMLCKHQAVIGNDYGNWERVFFTREEAEEALKGGIQ